jgi:hypothetical protein
MHRRATQYRIIHVVVSPHHQPDFQTDKPEELVNFLRRQ